MTPRLRKLTYGCAAALVVAGGVCAAFVNGLLGELLTLVLISVGLGGALLLVFLEIGLGEERELARDEQRRRARTRRGLAARRRARLQRGRRPD